MGKVFKKWEHSFFKRRVNHVGDQSTGGEGAGEDNREMVRVKKGLEFRVKKGLEYKKEVFIVDAVDSGEPQKNLQTA